jgi:glycosyltransferase involved in cell wall biosynthesis
MKVLFLQQGLGYGGASQSLIQMQKALKGEVEIFTVLKKNKRLNKKLKHLLSASHQALEMHLPGVHSYPEGISTLDEWARAKNFLPHELVDYINQNQIDILHVNSSVFSSLYEWVKQKTNVKIVTHVREVIPSASDPVTEFIIQQIRKHSDFIICIAEEEAIHFNDLRQCKILRNPVDTDYFKPNEDRDNRQYVIGMMANFNALKGHDTFITVVKKAMQDEDGKQWKFELVGMPSSGFLRWKNWLPVKSLSYYQKVVRMIKSTVNPNLRIIPFQSDVRPVIQNWHLAMRLERSMKPWGRDVIECMSMGIPMIALGSSEVMIRHKETGWLVKENNVDEIFQQLKNCLKDEGELQRVSKNARNWAERNLGLAEYSQEVIKIYKDIL